MTESLTTLKTWTKDKLANEIIRIRSNQMKELNTSTSSRKEDENLEVTKLKQELEHQKQLNEILQADVKFLREQTDKLLTNVLQQKNTNATQIPTVQQRQFYPKMVPHYSKQLIISDSSYKMVRNSDISFSATVHSYPSATVENIAGIIDNYSPGAKSECLIIHAGHNSIDQGVPGIEAAKQMEIVISKAITKLKPYKLAICKIPHVKNGSFGRESNNIEIDKFNKELEDMADCIRVEHQSIDIQVLDYQLENKDIRSDGIHPTESGVQKMVFCLRNYIGKMGYTASRTNVTLRNINNYYRNQWNARQWHGHYGY